MQDNFTKMVSKLNWTEVTALQQLCGLRKQQLRMLEPCVYAIRKDKQYLVYVESVEVWGGLNHPQLAVYPSYDVADYVRGQYDGSAVVKIPKKEFITLPSLLYYMKEGLVTPDGSFSG